MIYLNVRLSYLQSTGVVLLQLSCPISALSMQQLVRTMYRTVLNIRWAGPTAPINLHKSGSLAAPAPHVYYWSRPIKQRIPTGRNLIPSVSSTTMESTSSTRKFGLRISGTTIQLHPDVSCHDSDYPRADISCSNLPRVGRVLKHPGCFLLKATVAGITRRTYVAERSSSPSWEDPLSL
jgi:hypothetical protein